MRMRTRTGQSPSVELEGQAFSPALPFTARSLPERLTLGGSILSAVSSVRYLVRSHRIFESKEGAIPGGGDQLPRRTRSDAVRPIRTIARCLDVPTCRAGKRSCERTSRRSCREIYTSTSSCRPLLRTIAARSIVPAMAGLADLRCQCLSRSGRQRRGGRAGGVASRQLKSSN
jgi:hypothetical protein